jgi:hypothetical protein
MSLLGVTIIVTLSFILLVFSSGRFRHGSVQEVVEVGFGRVFHVFRLTCVAIFHKPLYLVGVGLHAELQRRTLKIQTSEPSSVRAEVKMR